VQRFKLPHLLRDTRFCHAVVDLNENALQCSNVLYVFGHFIVGRSMRPSRSSILLRTPLVYIGIGKFRSTKQIAYIVNGTSSEVCVWLRIDTSYKPFV
jgi:hypothetical protein